MLCLVGQPPVGIVCPDTVEIGARFTLLISSYDARCTSLSANPVFSDGLVFLYSRSMHSSSSINGVLEQNSVLELSYEATLGGMQTIGPLQVYLGNAGSVRVPAESIFVTVSVTGPRMIGSRARTGSVSLSIETVPPDERIYPGCPFKVSYYLVSDIFVKNAESFWGPPVNGTARLLDAPENLIWQVLPGNRRSRLISLEITAASDGEVRLPVLSANVWEAGPMFLNDGPLHVVSSDTVRLDVSSFPENGMPPCFSGLADSICLSLEEVSSGGRDRLLRLAATGPGASSLHGFPELSVSGPATISVLGEPRSDQGEPLLQDFLITPSDTGLIIAGPDSLAWFDREDERYRFAQIPPCSIMVHEVPASCDSMISTSLDAAKESSSKLLLAVLAALSAAMAVFAVLLLKKRGRTLPEIGEAGDTEELLSAFESELAGILTGKPGYVGQDDMIELLENAGMPLMLQRRTLRLWKDLEQALAVGDMKKGGLNALKDACRETLEEARRFLRERDG